MSQVLKTRISRIGNMEILINIDPEMEMYDKMEVFPEKFAMMNRAITDTGFTPKSLYEHLANLSKEKLP